MVFQNILFSSFFKTRPSFLAENQIFLKQQNAFIERLYCMFFMRVNPVRQSKAAFHNAEIPQLPRQNIDKPGSVQMDIFTSEWNHLPWPVSPIGLGNSVSEHHQKFPLKQNWKPIHSRPFFNKYVVPSEGIISFNFRSASLTGLCGIFEKNIYLGCQDAKLLSYIPLCCESFFPSKFSLQEAV